MPGLRRSARRPAQRGIATLAIVAVLFFIVALVAAYTNRNLIFEQRTSGNQWRSTMALEAAEAGVEWALAQLNTGRIGNDCRPTDDVAQAGFRERFLAIGDDGVVTPADDAQFACVANADGGWNCDCTADATPAPAPADGAGIFPAFRGRFLPSARPGVVRIEVNGCTRLDDRCLAFPSQALGNEGRASLQVLLALRSALPAPPAAAVTVEGSLTGAGTLAIAVPDTATGAVALLVSQPPTLAPEVVGAAGSPTDSDRLVIEDPTLFVNLPGPADWNVADRLFASVFLAPWATDADGEHRPYLQQPGALRLDCEAGCNGDDVRAAIALNPGRVLWIDGDVDLDGAAIGSTAAPVLMVVDGGLEVETEVFGVVYVRRTDPDDPAVPWASAGTGRITGALLVEGSASIGGALTVVHDADVLALLRRASGSFVRVPGSWADFGP